MPIERLAKAAEYRRQAQEIRTIVERIAVDEAREQLLETAEHLEELAQEAESKAHDDSSRRGCLNQTRKSANPLLEMHVVTLQDDAPGLRLGFGIWR